MNWKPLSVHCFWHMSRTPAGLALQNLQPEAVELFFVSTLHLFSFSKRERQKGGRALEQDVDLCLALDTRERLASS